MTTVIYHSADFDGIFCREIARLFLGDKDVNYIGWNFGDNPLDIPKEGTIYVMDLPPDKPFGGVQAICNPLLLDRFVWIDHHASSIKEFDLPPARSDMEVWDGNPLLAHPATMKQMQNNRLFPGYRIDGVAACRLCYQYFTHPASPFNKSRRAV